jgi:hypothetical protein
MISNSVQICVSKAHRSRNALRTVCANSQRWTGEEQQKDENHDKAGDEIASIRLASSMPWVQSAGTGTISKRVVKFRSVGPIAGESQNAQGRFESDQDGIPAIDLIEASAMTRLN